MCLRLQILPQIFGDAIRIETVRDVTEVPNLATQLAQCNLPPFLDAQILRITLVSTPKAEGTVRRTQLIQDHHERMERIVRTTVVTSPSHTYSHTAPVCLDG